MIFLKGASRISSKHKRKLIPLLDHDRLLLCYNISNFYFGIVQKDRDCPDHNGKTVGALSLAFTGVKGARFSGYSFKRLE